MTNFDVENRTQELGELIFSQSYRFFKKPFRKGYLTDKMMEWSMEHPDFKVEMFRFVDVLPTLVNQDQIIRHLKEYFLRSETKLPFWIRSGLSVATNLPIAENLTANLVKKNISQMAHTFITGEDAHQAVKGLRQIWDRGLGFTVDLLGEAAVAETETKDYQKRYLDLVENLAKETKPWPENPVLEKMPLGDIPRTNVSVKLSSLYSQIDPLAFRESVDAIKKNLRPVLEVAVKNNVFINIDMEQDSFRELFFSVAEEIFFETPFRDYPNFGLVIQAYLKNSKRDLERLIEYSKHRGVPLTARLVKGAYWDFEVIRAKQLGWEIPVFTSKSATDANYEQCVELLLKSYPHVLAAFGSHNVRSLSYAMAKAEELKLERGVFEIQMLYGMADAFKQVLVKQGYRVREYAPIGEMIPGMAYLVRRLLENSSNESFLRVKFMKPSQAKTFLEAPKAGENGNQSFDKNFFENESPIDFSKKENRDWIEPMFQSLEKKLPLFVHPMIDGNEVEGTPLFEVSNPSQISQVVTKFTMANQYHGDLAIKACEKALKTWSKWDAKRRADVIQKTGGLFKEWRREMIAMIVLETGKSLPEADADVCEAIDFCRYYAEQILGLSSPHLLTDLLGEENFYSYRARGIAVAIAPWNFPLAILTGMTVGPLVCGNPVIMKPAEQSTGVASYLYRALLKAGVPKEAVQFLPGSGEVIGEYLVNHSKVHIITFTGSKAVGLNILRGAYHPLPGQKHIKKVVAELGGKNGIIVDEDADLDEAVQGVLSSVFGFQGQKCSACSRIFVLESCYEKFKKRFVDAMLSLKMGPAENLDTKVGPVIDAEAKNRLIDVIQKHRTKVLAQLSVPQDLENEGHFVPPTIFEDTDPKSDLGQKEFFGPLVTLYKVQDLTEAILGMNGVDYALTGGIFSRSPANIERAKNELEVGNFYINRGITGAMVSRQPFGGFKLSGLGGKAGGPDYLLQFLEPITVTENTMRRGFAPGV